MEITIKLDSPKKLSSNILVKQSGYVSCSYNSDVVDYIRNLPIRAYHPNTKEWEINSNEVATFCNKFTDHEITLIGVYEKREEELAEIPPDFEFKTKPFAHQIDGVRYGLTHGNFLLGDDQGLGKTKQIIDLSNILRSQGKIKRTLIVCGVNSLKYNWQAEIETHSNEKSWVIGTRTRKNGKKYEGSAKDRLADLDNLPNVSFLITNIETLRLGAYKEGKKRIFPFVDKLQKLIDGGEIGVIALDESHKLKNPTSLQGMACLKLKAPYMIPMSGTFLMNSPLDMYFPLKWAGFVEKSFYAFKNHYCKLGGFGGHEVVGHKNLNEIRDILDQCMLRRLKTEVLDLPEKLHQNEYVEMTSKQAIIYKEVHNMVLSEINQIKFSDNPLAMLIRLRQATGYTGILSDSIQESAKLDRMVELVEELTSNGQKAVIFSNWGSITSQAKKRLKEYAPAYITGQTNASERMLEVNRFQNDNKCKVIIGTLGAMGTGLTLTAGQTVIFLDEPWNRALRDQAEDRCHRIGTKGTVNIITLICKNTIDERINNLVRKKGEMADAIVDGKLSNEDINYLLM